MRLRFRRHSSRNRALRRRRSTVFQPNLHSSYQRHPMRRRFRRRSPGGCCPASARQRPPRQGRRARERTGRPAPCPPGPRLCRHQAAMDAGHLGTRPEPKPRPRHRRSVRPPSAARVVPACAKKTRETPQTYGWCNPCTKACRSRTHVVRYGRLRGPHRTARATKRPAVSCRLVCQSPSRVRFHCSLLDRMCPPT